MQAFLGSWLALAIHVRYPTWPYAKHLQVVLVSCWHGHSIRVCPTLLHLKQCTLPSFLIEAKLDKSNSVKDKCLPLKVKYSKFVRTVCQVDPEESHWCNCENQFTITVGYKHSTWVWTSKTLYSTAFPTVVVYKIKVLIYWQCLYTIITYSIYRK